MKEAVILCLVLLVGSAVPATGDPIVFNTAQLTTSGVFRCMAEPACSASGNTVTLGSGDSAVTLTFTGISTVVPVSNEAVRVGLGTLDASSSSATFPTRTHPLLPIVRFDLTLTHTTPVGDRASLSMNFGPGGGTELGFLQGNTYMLFDPGDVPPGYGSLVYTLSPDVFGIPMNGSVGLAADAGVAPEPGTLLLVGSGLLLGYKVRKRRDTRACERAK